MRTFGAMSSMIEIMPDAGAGVTMLRFSGVQTSEDITGAVAAVIQLCDGRAVRPPGKPEIRAAPP